MYPVVPALPRTVTNSFELGGYTAPVLPVLDRESRCNRLLLPAGAERADDLVLPVLEGSRDLLVVGAEEPAHDLEGLEAAVPQWISTAPTTAPRYRDLRHSSPTCAQA